LIFKTPLAHFCCENICYQKQNKNSKDKKNQKYTTGEIRLYVIPIEIDKILMVYICYLRSNIMDEFKCFSGFMLKKASKKILVELIRNNVVFKLFRINTLC